MIQTLDAYHEGEYGHIFRYLTSYPVKFKGDLINSKYIVRFEDAIVGNSKIANWYQYGFSSPQGPIKNKVVNGYYVRQVTSYIESKIGINDHGTPDLLVIFSRLSNRLLTNEKEIIMELSKTYNLQPVFLRMEENSFEEQITVLRRTKVAIGMHGSILIMAMFLPPGSILLELFPYAVPPENYTPYKTLCGLQGMNLVYRSWSNKHQINNKMYPDRIPQFGGIAHLPQKEREKIMNTNTVPVHSCCTNPYWLFRIYQDTAAEISELVVLLDDAFKESKRSMNTYKFGNYLPFILEHFLRPATVTNIMCKIIYNDKKIKAVRIEWSPPWNKVNVDAYVIWEHLTFKEYETQTNFMEIESPLIQPGKTLEIWVKWVRNGKHSSFSQKRICEIP